MKSSQKFIHLRNYTQYSLSKGAIKVKDLVNKCLKSKIPAIGISDFGNLFGSMEFSLECKANGIQPIIGCNIYLVDNNFENGYLLLIAKNELGFKNLSRLVTISYLENSKENYPYISFNDLLNHSSGLICLAGGEFGFISKNYSRERISKVNEAIKRLNEIFSNDFFLEIQKDLSKNKGLHSFLITQSISKNIPLVATNENFFLDKSFYESHDALLSISEQKYLDSEDRLKSDRNFCFKEDHEIVSDFKNLPDALDNTVMIAKKCSFFLEEKNPKLPKINVENNDENSFLKKKSFEGLERRLKKNSVNKQHYEIYKDRLNFELNTIIKMGFASYFLIVSDFINWAKQNFIPVGPGRGSGAGSLVAWCLFITNLDPIKFGLLFERFLNPERVSLPDFDIDFCMDKRDEVIKYVQKKYGESNVAQIITFGSFQARAAIRDVGRVMQLPLFQVDEICKMIPFNPAQQISLSDVIDKDDKIKKIIASEPNIKKLFDVSKNLEGLLRHASTHAAGIVISDEDLTKSLPLYKDPKSVVAVTQFSMKYVEKIGLIKFDFLGLKTLTVIDETVLYLKKQGINLDLENILLDDKKTFALLKNGDTTGVFQLEGLGMRETLKNIIPDRFEDLIAVVSLYRPGPMDNIQTYINRKQKKEKYEYIHKELKNILDETYGIMVYQEQVMLIAQKVAGFSLAKADLLRRAMGKKIKSEMIAQKNSFVFGCEKNGLKNERALELFDEIEKFAGYGFNKSHAAAYAMIAYQTAYLKANYPLEFLCSLMNCDIGNFDKISSYINEVKKSDFKIFNPDINESEAHFQVIYDDKKNPIGIRYGLSAIKNIGENSVLEIIEERKKNGKFKSLVDLLKRVNNSALNKKIIEALIFSNSLISLEKNQYFLLDKMEEIILFNVNYHKNNFKNQNNLFSENNDDNIFNSFGYQNLEASEKLEFEFKAFGFYLSEHPTKLHKGLLKDKKYSDIKDLLDNNDNKINRKIIALISEKNERKSKTGKNFCFLKFSDDTGDIDTICFSEVLENLNFDLVEGKIVCASLVLQTMRETKKYVVASLSDIEKIESKKKFEVLINSNSIDYEQFKNFFKKSNTGDSELFFKIFYNQYKVEIKSDRLFQFNFNEISNLKKIEGVLDVSQIN